MPEILKSLWSIIPLLIFDQRKCIYQLRGVRPFYSDKFDITKHKNYVLLEDYDKKNCFDVEEYLKNKDKLVLKADDKITVLDSENVGV